MRDTKKIPTIISEEEAKELWRSADAVCFDVDSTVCRDEAIDEIADFMGCAAKVSQVTREAMNGVMSFRDALTQRLKVINLSRENLQDYLSERRPKLTPGIQSLVSTLQKRGVHVYLVSGGFRQVIAPVAVLLGIPLCNIFANILRFNEDGSFVGFDPSQPTSESGGKAMVCGQLKREMGYRRLVMVGDGATDLEACPPADAFVGFGGNQIRAGVEKEAPWFAYSFEEMEAVLLEES